MKTRLDSPTLQMACLAGVLLAASLPEDSVYLNEMLEEICRLLSKSKRKRLLGLHRLILVMMRVEAFSKAAAESTLATTLCTSLRRTSLDCKLSKNKPDCCYSSEESEGEEGMDSEEEEIIDDHLFEESSSDRRLYILPYVCFTGSSPIEEARPERNQGHSEVVPKLNFTWLKTVPSYDNLQLSGHREHNLSIDRQGYICHCHQHGSAGRAGRKC